MKVIEIKGCAKCPDSGVLDPSDEYPARRVCYNLIKEIPKGMNLIEHFPDWCPLPDKDKRSV